MFVVKCTDHQMSINEIDLNNPLQRQHFDNEFGFNESSVFDIPVINGVREFITKNGDFVIIGESHANVVCASSTLFTMLTFIQ